MFSLRSLAVCFLLSWHLKGVKHLLKYFKKSLSREKPSWIKDNEVFKTVLKSSTYRGYYICPRVDRNFIFECSSRCLTSLRSEHVRYRLEHHNIEIRIHKQSCNCLSYRHRWNTRTTISWANLFLVE